MKILLSVLLFLFLGGLPNAGFAQSGPNPDLVELVQRVVPSVVNVATTRTVKSPLASTSLRDRLNFNFFKVKAREPVRAIALGSGFIFDASGIIVTNNHVVADADETKISFTEDLDEEPTDGEVIGRDPETDVAVIRVKTNRKLVALPLGDSDQVRVGEWVIAVGNPIGQGHSVSHGIISALGRVAPQIPLADYFQTDAPINPGNSGGPLIDMDGRVIAINNAIAAGYPGIGFAIPVNVIKTPINQLIARGFVERGYIGVLAGDLTPERAEKMGMDSSVRAPFLSSVARGDPADVAGLKTFDVVLAVNGQVIHSAADLTRAVTSLKAGEVAIMRISRGGREQEVQVKIGRRSAGYSHDEVG